MLTIDIVATVDADSRAVPTALNFPKRVICREPRTVVTVRCSCSRSWSPSPSHPPVQSLPGPSVVTPICLLPSPRWLSLSLLRSTSFLYIINTFQRVLSCRRARREQVSLTFFSSFFVSSSSGPRRSKSFRKCGLWSSFSLLSSCRRRYSLFLTAWTCRGGKWCRSQRGLMVPRRLRRRQRKIRA